MSLTTGQLPDQPGINSTENQIASLRASLGALNMVENPSNLGTGEVSIDGQTSLVFELLSESLSLQAICNVSGLTGLPNNCVIYWTTSILIPNYSGLTLVGDTHGSDVASLQTTLLQSALHYFTHGAPDLICIMLNPTRLREVLSKLLLCNAYNLGVLIKDDCPVGSGTCI